VRWFRWVAGRLDPKPAGAHAEAFARHLDRWLGPGERMSWSIDEEGMTVVRFDGQPATDLATLVTFGLGHHLLSGPKGPMREELVLIVRQEQADGDVANRLAYEAVLVRNRGVATQPDELLLIGEAIGPRTHLRGCWVTRVHGFEPAFDTVHGSDRTFLLVQVVPLTTGEYDHAQAVGGHQFGHEIEPHWPDMLDLNRTPIFEPVGPLDGYHFVGIEDLDAAAPDDRVDRGLISRLKVGDLAKLRFLLEPVLPIGPVGEQMWVEIVRIEGDSYRGRLTNEPQYLLDLGPGFELEFERRHVLDVRLR
jgi:hypothetical protein